MAPPGGTVFLQRLADGTGLLAAQQRAIKLPAGWSIINHPTDSLSGDPSGPGQVTGFLELVPPAAPPLAGSSLTLGGATYGPAPTLSIGASPVALATVNVPIGKVTSFSLVIVGEIVLPTPGCILPLISYVTEGVGSYGNSGPVGVLGGSLTAGTFPAGIAITVGSTSTATTYSPTLVLGAIPAWAGTTAYTGTLHGSLPGNGVIVGASLVINAGELYVCSDGGTSAGSGGPTGTGSTAITDGTVTWWYVGPAATVLTLSCIAAVLPTVTG